MFFYKLWKPKIFDIYFLMAGDTAKKAQTYKVHKGQDSGLKINI